MLARLVRAGVDVFRINTAHGDIAQHEQLVQSIRKVSSEAGRPIGILLDLAGPKIRLGELRQDPTMCEAGAEFRFVRGETPGADNELTANYPRLVDELTVGGSVMLADGTVAMEVVAVDDESATCRVVSGGEIRSRQGINLPGAALSTPAMTDADREHALWAVANDIDFVSLSFVRSPNDVIALKDLLRTHRCDALVIAKIEKREALEQLESIVAVTDGVMVARGDLGVETDVAETPVAQKKIIATCQRYFKPVIVATQMLDSMHHSPRPTRAEATDVANAILDGADACMLSGETAIGDYPREAVAMMNRIMLATERMLHDAPAQSPAPPAVAGVHPITSAVVYGAAKIASQLFAKLVVVATRTGSTARVKSKQHDYIPTIGISDSQRTLRRLTLFWGIRPVAGAPLDNGPAMREFIASWGREDGCLAKGDRVVFVTGGDIFALAHNVVVVHEVE